MAYPRLYYDLAYLWPILDPPEDFMEEASFWRQILSQRLGPGMHNVLELGVGGGPGPCLFLKSDSEDISEMSDSFDRSKTRNDSGIHGSTGRVYPALCGQQCPTCSRGMERLGWRQRPRAVVVFSSRKCTGILGRAERWDRANGT